jgi:asparagine synthase (glutamine-hydrolysing)
MMLGRDPEAPGLPPADAAVGPRAALTAAIRPALARPPCLVSFSGGRDSSAVLATATAAARREGLPLPIPFSLRFPGRPLTEEWGWQEDLVTHLELPDWERREIGDELDFLGPFARGLLERRGLVYPANASFHGPILEAARGGSLLTGYGGDDVLGFWRWQRVADVLSRRARPRPRDGVRIAHSVLPARLKRSVAHRRLEDLPWLRTSANARFKRALAADEAGEPARWDRRTEWQSRARRVSAARSTLGELADRVDVRLIHALLDPGFLAALSAWGGRLGRGDRTAVMDALFADLLPPVFVSRLGKAFFDEVFWGPHSRAFIASWDGSGVDEELVDVEGLRVAWRAETPRPGTELLLQSAWLASARDGGQ